MIKQLQDFNLGKTKINKISIFFECFFNNYFLKFQIVKIYMNVTNYNKLNCLNFIISDMDFFKSIFSSSLFADPKDLVDKYIN